MSDRPAAFAPLRHEAFRDMWVAQFGSNIGGLAWIIAQQAGLSTTLVIAAAGLVSGPVGAIRWPLRPIDPEQLLPAGEWPAPQVLDADTHLEGPVLVRVGYHGQPGRETELLAALSELRYSRRRTGASSWRVWHEL